jgi:hypothetical protein
MENAPLEKPWYKKRIWQGIIFVIAGNILFGLASLNKPQNTQLPEKIKMEPSVPVNIPNFEIFKDQDIGFEVLLPEPPKKDNYSILNSANTGYTAYLYIDENNFVQYRVSYYDDEIYNKDAIDAYLDTYLIGKTIGKNGSIIINSKRTQYKGFPALNYRIQFEKDGVTLYNDGLEFIANGDPISLSINYPASLNYSDVHFEDFINSFNLN